MTLTGAFGKLIGISPLPLFSMGSNNVLEVSLSPYRSWQKAFHLILVTVYISLTLL